MQPRITSGNLIHYTKFLHHLSNVPQFQLSILTFPPSTPLPLPFQSPNSCPYQPSVYLKIYSIFSHRKIHMLVLVPSSIHNLCVYELQGGYHLFDDYYPHISEHILYLSFCVWVMPLGMLFCFQFCSFGCEFHDGLGITSTEYS